MANNYVKIRDQMLSAPGKKAKYQKLKNELIEISQLISAIDQAREQLGMSKKQLADLAGLEPANVRRLFSSEFKNVSMLTLLRLSRALGLRLVIK
jgi:ribosome-binding protein aMBF1 (putative translation factor)